MMLLRASTVDDFDDIMSLAKMAQVTNIPPDTESLQQRLQSSEQAFAGKVAVNEPASYYFVLEDTEQQKVVGISAIMTNVGAKLPNYHYRLSQISRQCHSLALNTSYEKLCLVNDFNQATELCALYLHPDYRRDDNGKLLSRARLLYMAQHLNTFNQTIFAELRGVFDNNMQSPFWQSLAAHFFPMTFEQADLLSATTDKQFISDLMPRSDIHLPLLSEQAQSVIGQPHPQSKAAMKLLQYEGFRYQGYVDIFDAGPIVSADIEQITTINKSEILPAALAGEIHGGDNYFVATTASQFGCTRAKIIKNRSGSVIINQQTAQLLNITEGQSVRIISCNKQ